jgi:hypothetical protein
MRRLSAEDQQYGFGADALPSDEERIPTFKNAIFKLGGIWSVEKFALVQLLRKMQKVEIVA